MSNFWKMLRPVSRDKSVGEGSAMDTNDAEFAAEIARFLASPDPEVLCIVGKWGVGKTFAWNHYLRKAKDSEAIALEKYAYVSLFGLDSISDVKNAIVENTVDSRVVDNRPDLKSYDNVIGHVSALGTDLAKLMSYFPASAGAVGGLNRALYLGTARQIVCLDDLERRGKGLETKSIMGIASSLREDKLCKVVLLLNREKIDLSDATQFDEQLEKVADCVLEFAPSSKLAAKIAISPNKAYEAVLSECVTKLDIVNIRVIKKAERACSRVFDILEKADSRVLNQAVQTLCLLVFAKYQPDEAPSLDVLSTFNAMRSLLKKDEGAISEKKQADEAALRNYGFLTMDDFDRVLADGVVRGYFDKQLLNDEAAKLHEKLKSGDEASAFKKAWDLFHTSFDNNESAVMDALSAALQRHAKAITPGNLDSVVSFLKEFDRVEEAADCIVVYVRERSNESRAFWDLPSYPFHGNVTDEDVKNAFKTKLTELNVSKPDLLEVINSIGAKNGWNERILSLAAAATSEEYYQLFKRVRGEDFYVVLGSALTFKDIGNRTPEMEAINTAVFDALRRIAREGRLNAKRVRNLGVPLG